MRQDTSCGFHIHTSTRTGRFALDQMQRMAKAVVFWEPATMRCAPWSRHDSVSGFCKSNIKRPAPVAADLEELGPLRGLVEAFEKIDHMNAEEIVDSSVIRDTITAVMRKFPSTHILSCLSCPILLQYQLPWNTETKNIWKYGAYSCWRWVGLGDLGYHRHWDCELQRRQKSKFRVSRPKLQSSVFLLCFQAFMFYIHALYSSCVSIVGTHHLYSSCIYRIYFSY